MFDLRSLSVIALFAVLLAGCGGSSDGGELGSGRPVEEDPGGNGGVGHSDLQGVWQSRCFPLPAEGAPDEGQVLNYTFEGGRVTQVVDVYEDQQCQGEPYFHPKLIWNYTTGAVFTSADGVEATEIDFTLIDEVPPNIAEAEHEYDIFALDSTGDELYFGLGGSTLNKATRPKQLDFSFPMHRQP